jgi:EXS family
MSPESSGYSPSFGLTLARFLRPQLLLPDPLIYYLAIVIDLLLRFTWSLRLSSHLHVIHELEQGTFFLEALEVIRRWMWVFIRVEWEGIRKGVVVSKSGARDDRPGVGLGLGLGLGMGLGGSTATIQQARAAEEGYSLELSDQSARDEKIELGPLR